jgi:hypothetical protein
VETLDPKLTEKFELMLSTDAGLESRHGEAWIAINEFPDDYIGKYSLVPLDDLGKHLPIINSHILNAVIRAVLKVTVKPPVTDDEHTQQRLVLKLHRMLSYMLYAKKHPKSMKHRLLAFIEYRWAELIDDMINCLLYVPPPTTEGGYKGQKSSQHIDSLKLRVNRHIANGELGKAKSTLVTPMQQAPAGSELMKLLNKKHPKRSPQEVLVEEMIEEQLQNIRNNVKPIKTAEMSKIIWKLGRGVSPAVPMGSALSTSRPCAAQTMIC